MSLLLDEVTLTYPDGADRVRALDRVSLRLDEGELALLVGPSGSGKSSLLAVAATLIVPDSGRVVIGGIDTTGRSRAELSALRRDRVGLVFQQPNLLPALTVAEQLQVMGHLGGRRSAQISSRRVSSRRVAQLLESVGMAAYADRRPDQLSGGQRQRVNVARALVNEPSVLLVDEPTAALDRERGAAVMDLLRAVNREHGTSTVIVTHDTELIGADERVLQCRDGRIQQPAGALG